MPFGLCRTTTTFQRLLANITKKFGNLTMCYVDDVVIATPTLWDSTKYLGRMVDKHGVRPDPDAVEAVLTCKAHKRELLRICE